MHKVEQVSYPLQYQRQRCSHWGGQEGHAPPTTTSISKLNKVQQFQFQTSRVLLYMGVQKLNRPEISQFSLCMQQFLDHSRRLFIFFNYIRGLHVGEKHSYKGSTIKDQKSNYDIPLDLRKRSSKIRENFVSDQQLNTI